jgi:homoaconitase/3-isopropylmalate dehydratase large subunit
MPKLRIIISGKPKIMISSKDVYFAIIRQFAQVEPKNINIFSTKNHICRSGRNGKTFL